jgi:sugar/nucleoside kinase (ribokinase family)
MGPDVVGLGEAVVDFVASIPRFPDPDEKINAKRYAKFPGGVTANFCVDLSKMGVRTAFVGGVGLDHDGAYLLKALEDMGVDVSRAVKRSDEMTPVNIVLVNEAGQKEIIQSPSMLTVFPRPDELDLDLIASSKVLHTTALRADTAEVAMSYARKRGVLVSFDLEKHVAEYGGERLAPLIRLTDILMPNRLGALSLTGARSPEEAAEQLLEMGPKVVVITLGDGGCLVRTADEVQVVPAFKVDAVDATGAGDAFNAGFILGVLEGWDYTRCAEFANACGAIKVTRPGAQSGPKSREEVLAFMREHLR